MNTKLQFLVLNVRSSRNVWVGVRRRITVFYGQKELFSLGPQSFSYAQIINYTKLSIHNDMNEAATSGEGPTSNMCPIGQHGGPGGHHATAENPRERQCELVSCRNRSIFSPFNSRILNQPSCLSKLVRSAKEKNIDNIAVQEHRFFHPDTYIIRKKKTIMSSQCHLGRTLATHLLEVYVSYFSSTYGKCFVLDIQNISSRILIADIQGNPTTAVISCYSSQSTAVTMKMN